MISANHAFVRPLRPTIAVNWANWANWARTAIPANWPNAKQKASESSVPQPKPPYKTRDRFHLVSFRLFRSQSIKFIDFYIFIDRFFLTISARGQSTRIPKLQRFARKTSAYRSRNVHCGSQLSKHDQLPIVDRNRTRNSLNRKYSDDHDCSIVQHRFGTRLARTFQHDRQSGGRTNFERTLEFFEIDSFQFKFRFHSVQFGLQCSFRHHTDEHGRGNHCCLAQCDRCKSKRKQQFTQQRQIAETKLAKSVSNKCQQVEHKFESKFHRIDRLLDTCSQRHQSRLASLAHSR